MIIRNALYPDSMFRRRFDAPTRERVVAAFILGVVIGTAIIGVGWLVLEFLQRLP